jgi:hypothetical protein
MGEKTNPSPPPAAGPDTNRTGAIPAAGMAAGVSATPPAPARLQNAATGSAATSAGASARVTPPVGPLASTVTVNVPAAAKVWVARTSYPPASGTNRPGELAPSPQNTTAVRAAAATDGPDTWATTTSAADPAVAETATPVRVVAAAGAAAACGVAATAAAAAGPTPWEAEAAAGTVGSGGR